MESIEAQVKALRESAISTLIAAIRLKTGLDKSVPVLDLRATLGDSVDDLINNVVPDESSWPFVKTRYLYDIYLQMREEEGTLTELDLTRPGLTSGLFSSDVEYHKHCVRVGDVRNSDPTALKVCSSCGLEKMATKFSKRGGAVCFACRGKKYRERKANRAD